jgi:hypothetical protein
MFDDTQAYDAMETDWEEEKVAVSGEENLKTDNTLDNILEIDIQVSARKE